MFNFSFFNKSEKRLHLARGVLVDACPFFSSIALNMNFVKADEEKTKTCLVAYDEYSGFTFYYNDKYIKSISFGPLCTFFANRILHTGLMHDIRGRGKVVEVWDEASNIVINGFLRQYGYKYIPVNPYRQKLGDDTDKYTVEQIYDWLMGLPQNKDKKPPPNESGDSDDEMQEAVKRLMRKSQLYHGNSIKNGKTRFPELYQMPKEKKEKTQYDWKQILEQYVRRTLKEDYSWTRPSRRYGQDIIMPSLTEDNITIPNIAIAIDTSGSINVQIAHQFIAELDYILETFNVEATIYQCDDKIQEVRKITRADIPLKIEFKGGNGTDFGPVFRAIESGKDNPPNLVIYLTDSEGSYPEKFTLCPVIWAVYLHQGHQPRPVPFGEVVIINKKGKNNE